MPYCRQVSLGSLFPESHQLTEDQARLVFQQIFENLLYLRERRICHRDLSLGNCMVLRGRVIFSDLARSFQLPPEGCHVNGTGRHGTFQYQPPEVYMNYPFDAYGCDLWAAMVMFCHLVTGQVLYNEPIASDMCFRYFVMAEGFSMNQWNELACEVWADLDETDRRRVNEIMLRITTEVSPEAREILARVLRMTAIKRWGHDDVARSPFLMNPPI